MKKTAITEWISVAVATEMIKEKIAAGDYKKGEIKKSSYRFKNGKDKTDGYLCKVLVLTPEETAEETTEEVAEVATAE